MDTVKSEEAVATFADGFNCAQATFSVFSERFGLSREICLRVAACFGGGVANMGETCGTVCGALMAIGLGYGSIDPKDQVAREAKYAAIREYLEEFEARHGSVICRELLGCDLSTPEGRQRAQEAGLFNSVCPILVKSSVEMAERIISRRAEWQTGMGSTSR